MDVETGILTAMALGISGGAVLTAWCLWSRSEEIHKTNNPKK
ncbi:hypothetical protein SAMN04488490_1193 [Marinobacter sp. LV10R510-11A]|nr:hypothetical protein SAMN04488490_1193 [Marinobacter sp. LV10R510-11A]